MEYHEIERDVRAALLEWGSKKTWLVSREDLEALIRLIDIRTEERDKANQKANEYARECDRYIDELEKLEAELKLVREKT